MSISQNWLIKEFDSLTPAELYLILQLRNEIFVVEQNCVFQDLDGLDQVSTHLFTMKDNRCHCYARITPSKDSGQEYSIIGRLIIAEEFRGNKWGYDLMNKSIEVAKRLDSTSDIKIAAQKHLQFFYQKCGFVYQGEDYILDGIPHCDMYYQ